MHYPIYSFSRSGKIYEQYIVTTRPLIEDLLNNHKDYSEDSIWASMKLARDKIKTAKQAGEDYFSFNDHLLACSEFLEAYNVKLPTPSYIKF